MISFFGSPEVQAAIINSLTTVIVGVAGLGVLFWRLRQEAKLVIDENKSIEGMKLKLKIYEEEVIKTVERFEDAEVALLGFVRQFVSDVTNYLRQTQSGFPSSPPAARIPTLIKLKSEFDRAAAEVISFTEKWFVIDPRIVVFRTAINAATHDATHAYAAYFECVMPRMPTDLANGLHWAKPDNDALNAINSVSDTLLDRLQTVGATVYDFEVEMQTVLVGPLFGRAVPARQPLDPRHVVVSLREHKALERHFEENTAWGRHKRKIEAGVRDSLPK